MEDYAKVYNSQIRERRSKISEDDVKVIGIDRGRGIWQGKTF